MLIKWFKYGSGDSTAAFNYLLNNRVEQGTSKVIRGSSFITKAITKSLKTKKKYKSGCLSFSETTITLKQQEYIMDLFEKILFPGIPKENRNSCWVLHTDKKRIELNFVIPRVELSSNKAFQPYYDKVDRKRFELFRDFINQKFHFTNPNDSKKEQSLNLGEVVKYKKVEHIKHLNEYLQNKVSKGELNNQSDVVEQLQKVGYTISRVGNDYISVKTKNSKAIRLKGPIYSRVWTKYKEDKKTPLNSLLNELNKEIKKSSTYNRMKYYDGLNIDEEDSSLKQAKCCTLTKRIPL